MSRAACWSSWPEIVGVSPPDHLISTHSEENDLGHFHQAPTLRTVARGLPLSMSTEWTESRRLLDEGLAALEMNLPDEAPDRLMAYLRELVHWNSAYNLTAVRKPEDMAVRHLLDSLVILPHLPEGQLVDVGTGPGLPGIPLAIARPGRHFTLLDSNGKKAAFLRHAQRALRLENVTVVQERVEDYANGNARGLFDGVLSRAFTSLGEMLELAGPLCSAKGSVLAMKGRLPDDEIEELQHLATGFELKAIVPLQVPGLAAERHLVLFSRA